MKTQKVEVKEENGMVTLENEYVIAKFAHNGILKSFYDKKNKRDITEVTCIFLFFSLISDWFTSKCLLALWGYSNVLGCLVLRIGSFVLLCRDVDVYHLEKRKEVEQNNVQFKILEKGPLRATIEVWMTISKNSTLKQIISLSALSPR